MADTTAKKTDTTKTEPALGYVTYGGVNDRPDDVNHPDNLEAAANNTDPADPFSGYTYDEKSDTYTRSTN